MMTHSAHYTLPNICKAWLVHDGEGGGVIDQAEDVAIEHPEPGEKEVGVATYLQSLAGKTGSCLILKPASHRL